MHINLLIARLLCWWVTASQVIWWRTFWFRQKIQVRQWLNVDSEGLVLGIPKRGLPYLYTKNWPNYCLTPHASFCSWCLSVAISFYDQCGTWTQSSSSLMCLCHCLTRFPFTLSPMAADHFDIHIFFQEPTWHCCFNSIPNLCAEIPKFSDWRIEYQKYLKYSESFLHLIFCPTCNYPYWNNIPKRLNRNVIFQRQSFSPF